MTSNNNGPVSITASSGNINMTAGTQSQAVGLIQASNSTVTISASGFVTVNASSATNALNAYSLIQSAKNLGITATSILFTGGSSSGSYANIQTTQGGNITLNAGNGISFTGGASAAGNCESSVYAMGGGAISMTGLNVFFDGGTTALAPVNIMTGVSSGVGSISILGVSNFHVNSASMGLGVVSMSTGIQGGSITLDAGAISGSMIFNKVNIQTRKTTGSNDITIDGGAGGLSFDTATIKTSSGNVTLNSSTTGMTIDNSTIFATVPAMGFLKATAGTDITLNANTSITVKGSSGPLAQFIVDNNNPMSVGTGKFVYPVGASLKVIGTGFVRIYSAAQSVNMVSSGSTINGAVYTPGTPGVNTAHEYWNTFFPTVQAFPSDGSVNFTIYYKSLNM